MTRRTQAQWQALIEEQATSGLTATEFCKQRGINDKYFSMRKQKLAKSSSQLQEASFTALKVHSKTASIEIITQSTTVRVPCAQSPEWLASFVKALLHIPEQVEHSFR